jgi:hypothetical protein
MLAHLQNAWRKMREYIRRKLGRSVVFIAVVELQGNGNPHLHVLVGSYLHKRWISSAWQRLGGGWSTRIEYVDVHRITAYLAKYFTEDSVRNLPAGTRRFSTSRGLALFDRSKGTDSWVLVKSEIEFLRSCAARIVAESYETESDGTTKTLICFIADQVMEPFKERLEGGAPLAIEVRKRSRS